jgi:hypothetical protein
MQSRLVSGSSLRTLLVFCLALSGAHAAWAALGGDEGTIEADRQMMSRQARRAQPAVHESFTMHEITNGPNVLREYVSADGTVFGIAWTGLSHPDFSKVLGTYWAEFHQSIVSAQEKAATPHHRMRAQTSVSTPNIVVVTGGHMRAIRGKAYIPSLLPQGVTPDEIR